MSNHFIAGRWIDGAGAPMIARDPSNGEPIYRGRRAATDEIAAAVAAARGASETWGSMPVEHRITLIQKFGEALTARRASLVQSISRGTGKPLWESATEVDAMVGKIAISVAAMHQRRTEQRREEKGAVGVTRYRPLGVMAVLGPFNLPGHLPNGHIVPALLAGNAVVFKPSERTPLVGRETMLAWEAAGLPAGVINMIQGDGPVGAALAGHRDIDGLAFTGSYAVGKMLSRLLSARPQVMLALEMGGNNPLIAWDVDDPAKAAYWIAQSAYITSGQRCSCARRLIVSDDDHGAAIIKALVALIPRLRIGKYADEPQPFMGPMITPEAADAVMAREEMLVLRGGKALVPALQWSRTFVSASLVDVTNVRDRDDKEIFGPLLTVSRAPDFDAALAEANRTKYGLAAGLFSRRPELFEQFLGKIRAGVVNFNRPLTGASSALPFGGLGWSGNHRPSAAFATDYCSDPIASLEADVLAPIPSEPIGIDPAGGVKRGRL
jgi:succinylglutamic semialdehyde dehydrogenase